MKKLFIGIFVFLAFGILSGFLQPQGLDAVEYENYSYSASKDNTIRKIDPDGNEVWSFDGHTNDVYAVSVDDDGYVYSGSSDETVRKIDPDGNEVWSFDGHTDDVYAVSVDDDGYVYSGSTDETVRKIDPDGNEVWSYTGRSHHIFSIDVDSSGNVYVGSGSDIDNLGYLDKIDSSGDLVWSYDNHQASIRGLDLDGAGNIYTASVDDTVHKIDSDGNKVWEYTEHTDNVNDVAVNENGVIYSASWDDTVHKIDSTGNQIWSFDGHTDDVRAVSLDADGYVYSGSWDDTVRKIDPDGNEVWSFDGHTNDVYAVSSYAQVDTIDDIYTVTFEDWDGIVLKEETVEDGSDATPPDDPTRDYMVFDSWEGDYTNVQEDETVTATYKYDRTDHTNEDVAWVEDDGTTWTYNDFFEGNRLDLNDFTNQSGDGTEMTIDDELHTIEVTEEGVRRLVFRYVHDPDGDNNGELGDYYFTFLPIELNYEKDTNIVGTSVFGSLSDSGLVEGTAEEGEFYSDYIENEEESSTISGITSDFSSSQPIGSKMTLENIVFEVYMGDLDTVPELEDMDEIRDVYLSNSEYKVTFEDHDGSILKEEIVENGEDATPPDDPEREGYTFDGWDGIYTDVQKDETVTATYDINEYTVTFEDYDGTVLKEETVEYGEDATPPDDPEREGYTFDGWDGIYTDVQKDETVTATYDINEYTVTFEDYDGTVLKEETVEYGEDATSPDDPERDGYVFDAWDGNFTDVEQDETVVATYEEEDYDLNVDSPYFHYAMPESDVSSDPNSKGIWDLEFRLSTNFDTDVTLEIYELDRDDQQVGQLYEEDVSLTADTQETFAYGFDEEDEFPYEILIDGTSYYKGYVMPWSDDIDGFQGSSIDFFAGDFGREQKFRNYGFDSLAPLHFTNVSEESGAFRLEKGVDDTVYTDIPLTELNGSNGYILLSTENEFPVFLDGDLRDFYEDYILTDDFEFEESLYLLKHVDGSTEYYHQDMPFILDSHDYVLEVDINKEEYKEGSAIKSRFHIPNDDVREFYNNFIYTNVPDFENLTDELYEEGLVNHDFTAPQENDYEIELELDHENYQNLTDTITFETYEPVPVSTVFNDWLEGMGINTGFIKLLMGFVIMGAVTLLLSLKQAGFPAILVTDIIVLLTLILWGFMPLWLLVVVGLMLAVLIFVATFHYYGGGFKS